MRLNGLVASPSFAAWMEGARSTWTSLLLAPDGRPRASDPLPGAPVRRGAQFVVTLVLSKVVTWMRGQSGHPDLRALVYMDEVFGFAPPTAAPPSKKPILTIFKQARAHGVGMVLATQNPVDLDYKAMSNAGTWMIGRLRPSVTRRAWSRGSRASAAATWTCRRLDTAIGGLGKRQFLLQQARTPKRRVLSALAGRCRTCAGP
jgi:hypothetical protein